MVGVRGNRSIQDEKLLAAIFSTTRAERPWSTVGSPAPEREDSGSSKETLTSLDGDLQKTNAEALEDAVIARLRGDGEQDWPEPDEKQSRVYGAQQRNMNRGCQANSQCLCHASRWARLREHGQLQVRDQGVPGNR